MKRFAFVSLLLVMNAASSLAAADSGPGVILLSGTVRGRIEVPRYTTLQGLGRARIVGNVLLNEGSSIDGVEITGWTDSTWNYSAGVLIRGNFASVRDCFIHDGPSHGIQVIGGFSNARILGNRIHRVGAWRWSGSDRYPMAGWRGISLEAGSHAALVAGNEIVDPWESGIFEHDSPGVVIRENVIVRPNRGRVDRWNPGSGNGIESLSDRALIERNTVQGATNEGSFRGRSGIVIGGDAAMAVANTVARVTGSGILALGDSDARVIMNNVVHDVGAWSENEAGIRLFSYSGVTSALGTSIIGNHVARVRGGMAIRTGNRGRVLFSLVAGNILNGLRLHLEGANEIALGNV